MTSKRNMRVFKVSNTTHHFQTILADEPEVAKKIAIKSGHARKESSITTIVDVTSDFGDRHNMKELLDKGKSGYIVTRRISGLEHGEVSWVPNQCKMFTPTSTEMKLRLVRIDV